MNHQLLLDNLISWSVEVAILVIAAGAAASVALHHPRARLYFWQAILGVILLLPAVALFNRPTVVAPEFAAPVVSLSPASPSVPPARPPAWRIEPVLGLLALGTALRLLWVGAGLLRLTRIRGSAQPLREPPVGFSADIRWYVSDQISGPVTFGWLRPSILLPAPVRALPAGVQEAIASHELRHIDRRDWLFVMGEEIIRSLLWFHLAVWFVLSQIQLAREQVVDQEVVRATRDRACYLDALMAVAAHKLQPDVAPAPLFLKKRQLAVRVAAIVKENSMSLPRLAAHVTAAASVAIVGLSAAVWFFPMQSSAQVLPDDAGITVEPGATLAHRAPVHYPQGSIVRGDVLVELSLNPKGEVADARVLSGPEELRKAALASVLEWHYAADTAPPSTVRATIHFGQAVKMAPPPPPQRPAAAVRTLPPPQPAPPPEIAVVQRIEFRGLSPELQQRVESGLTVREGDTLNVGGLVRELRKIDEHLQYLYRPSESYDAQRANVILTNLLPGDGGVQPAATRAPGMVMVGGAVMESRMLSRVPPSYPESAKTARIQGAVNLDLVVGPDGKVQDVQVISGPALLTRAAVDSVWQWVYQPFQMNGQPVTVQTNTTVNFVLR